MVGARGLKVETDLVDDVTDGVSPPVQGLAVGETHHQRHVRQEDPSAGLLPPAVRRVDAVSPGLSLT